MEQWNTMPEQTDYRKDPESHRLYNFKEPGFLNVRHYLFSSGIAAQLGPFNVMVYLCVLRHVDWTTGNAKISGGMKTINQETGISRKTIMACLDVLKRFKLIWFRGNQGSRRIYWALHQSEWKNITNYTWKHTRKDIGSKREKHRKYKQTEKKCNLELQLSKAVDNLQKPVDNLDEKTEKCNLELQLNVTDSYFKSNLELQVENAENGNGMGEVSEILPPPKISYKSFIKRKREKRLEIGNDLRSDQEAERKKQQEHAQQQKRLASEFLRQNDLTASEILEKG